MEVTINGIRYEVIKPYNGEAYAAVIGLNDNIEKVEIASQIRYEENDYPVTYISNEAFSDETSLIECKIPFSVRNIGNGAFWGCKNLTKLILSNGLKHIGDSSFFGCEKLTHITIPNTVISIDQAAFSNCGGLVSITIPNSVKTIYYDNIFSKSNNLTIYCEAAGKPSGWNDNWNSKDYPVVWGCTNFGDFNGILYVLKGSELHVIGYSDSDREINLPIHINQAEVTHIGQAAFKGCRGLKEANISNVIVKIGINAFENCSSLESVIFSKKSSSYWDGIITQPIFSSNMVVDFKYFEPISLNLQNFPYGANDNSTLTYAGCGDTDFIGFTFNGMHSWLDLGILRVNNSNRYMENLTPEKNELVADVPGGNGQYYFGSYHKNKKFTVDFAFDNLTEVQIRKLKQLCANEKVCDLIFDETPYKVYSAKITSTPQIKYICFSKNNNRIYKGEGSIEFTCYWPYAHTPNAHTSISKNIKENGKFERDGRILHNYIYPNRQEWDMASGIKDTFMNGHNFGDLPASFILKDFSPITTPTTYRVGSGHITVDPKGSVFNNLTWNSKTGLVTATVGSQLGEKLIYCTGVPLGTIPVSGVDPIEWGKTTDFEEYTQNNLTLEYDFWYY